MNDLFAAVLTTAPSQSRMSRVPTSEPESWPRSPIQPGQRFATALLGIPLGDRLPLFHDDETITTHRLASDADLTSRIGRGNIARSDVGERFRREAALWDEASSFLLIPNRFADRDAVPARGIQLSAPLPPDQAEAPPEAGEVALLLTDIARVAAAAGEAVYLSRGGWTAPPNEEYALFVSTPSPTGEPMSHVETFPHPPPGTIWDLFENRHEGRAVVVRSPLDAGLDGVGPLLFAAASPFCPPNELALSYIESRS
jgi:hypothetical protein